MMVARGGIERRRRPFQGWPLRHNANVGKYRFTHFSFLNLESLGSGTNSCEPGGAV